MFPYFVDDLMFYGDRDPTFQKSYVPLFYWCLNILRPETYCIPSGIFSLYFIEVLMLYTQRQTPFQDGYVPLFIVLIF